MQATVPHTNQPDRMSAHSNHAVEFLNGGGFIGLDKERRILEANDQKTSDRPFSFTLQLINQLDSCPHVPTKRSTTTGKMLSTVLLRAKGLPELGAETADARTRVVDQRAAS